MSDKEKKVQRKTAVKTEMADEPKKVRKTKTAKVVASASAPASASGGGGAGTASASVAATSGGAASGGGGAGAPTTLGSVPEGFIADTSSAPPEDLPRVESSLSFCPVCENYLYMNVEGETQELSRICRKCGFKEKDLKGGLIMEMTIQEKSSEGYKILLNEFTRSDPRLPHIRKNITCPNVACESNHGGKDPDVIYIKYDNVNLMYLYICDICGEQWHSRSRS